MDTTTTTTTGSAMVTLGAATLASFGDVLESARAFAAESVAPRTREAYAYQWRTFAAWCEAQGVVALPASAATLAAYLADRAERCAWKPASIGLALVAVRAAHKAAGVEHATSHPAVVATMKGIRRTLGTAQRRAAPVVVDELRAMVDALPADSLGAVRDRALLVVGMAGALRRSELVGLDVSDVTETADGLVLTIRRAKTDQEAQGARIGLPYGNTAATCPVRALRAWRDASGVTDGALFRAVDRHGHVGERLHAADVARVVKRAAGRAGLDAARYSGHSLRAGLATSAARAGRSDRAIMAQGRWSSRAMVDRYVREGSMFRENAAAGIGL
jgi:integrase